MMQQKRRGRPPKQPIAQQPLRSITVEQPVTVKTQPNKLRVLQLVTLITYPLPNNPSCVFTKTFDPAINPIVSDPGDIALIVAGGYEYEVLN